MTHMVSFAVAVLLALPSFASPVSQHMIDRSASLTSIFENSTATPQYCYVEDIKDGRGYTAGIAGFTTGTGDLMEVAKAFVHSQGSGALVERWMALMPTLEARAKDGSEKTEGLRALPRLWKNSCRTRPFRMAQDVVVEKLYRGSAKREFARLGLKSTLAFAAVYDTIIQHGYDDDADDTFQDVLRHMRPTRVGDEGDFLLKFLESRRAVLMNPHDPRTRDAWRDSVDRVDALTDLVKRGEWELRVGTRVHVWGRSFQIK